MPETTWWLDIEALDAAYAHFEHRPPSPMIPGSATFRVNREEWEKLGRPATIKMVVSGSAGPGSGSGSGE